MSDECRRAILRPMVILCLIVLSPAVWALRCQGRLIDVEDRAAQVIQKCGQPNYRDHYRRFVAPGVPAMVEIQTWYYNFGPQQLISILHFRQGVLRHIATGEYGFDTPTSGHCEPETIDVGMSKYALLAHCGQPKTKHALLQYRPFRIGTMPSPGPFTPARVEDWTYTFGSNRFARNVRLINGVVRRIEIAD